MEKYTKYSKPEKFEGVSRPLKQWEEEWQVYDRQGQELRQLVADKEAVILEKLGVVPEVDVDLTGQAMVYIEKKRPEETDAQWGKRYYKLHDLLIEGGVVITGSYEDYLYTTFDSLQSYFNSF